MHIGIDTGGVVHILKRVSGLSIRENYVYGRMRNRVTKVPESAYEFVEPSQLEGTDFRFPLKQLVLVQLPNTEKEVVATND